MPTSQQLAVAYTGFSVRTPHFVLIPFAVKWFNWRAATFRMLVLLIQARTSVQRKADDALIRNLHGGRETMPVGDRVGLGDGLSIAPPSTFSRFRGSPLRIFLLLRTFSNQLITKCDFVSLCPSNAYDALASSLKQECIDRADGSGQVLKFGLVGSGHQ